MNNTKPRAAPMLSPAPVLLNKSFSDEIKAQPEKYPYHLERSFSRVLAKIAEVWGTAQAHETFIDLLVDKRGNRKGFPPKVTQEILVLRDLHAALFRGQQLPGSRIARDTLTRENTREFRVDLEARDIKFSAAEFFASIARGDLSAVALFIRAGMDIDTPNDQGGTPLTVALFEGRADLARLLMSQGANVNASDSAGYRPIHWAAFKGYTAIVEDIIARGGNVNDSTVYGWTALLQAAALGHLATVELLLRHGAAPNALDREGGGALHKAARNHHPDIVRALILGGAERDLLTKDQSTAMHIAARLGYANVVQALSEMGCSRSAEDWRGATPLHLAAANSHVVIVEQLVSLNSPIAARDKDGATPLVYAVRAGALDAARYLTSAGADIREIIGLDIPNISVQTHSGLSRRLIDVASRLKMVSDAPQSNDTLHRCIELNDVVSVKELLDNNQNLKSRNVDGRTALEFAAIKGNDEVWWLLVERGAGRISD